MKSRRSIVVSFASVPSVVTGHAVIGGFLLPVTGDAEFHRVLHRFRCNCHLLDLAMTGDAVNALADMRSVIESDMRFLNPAPDALPGNVLSLVVIGFQLVDLLAVRQGRRVTIPACPNVGKRSDGATFDRNVAVHAGKLNFANVNIVRESDGLLRVWPISKEVRHRLRD